MNKLQCVISLFLLPAITCAIRHYAWTNWLLHSCTLALYAVSYIKLYQYLAWINKAIAFGVINQMLINDSSQGV